jgi:hypothetical protein
MDKFYKDINLLKKYYPLGFNKLSKLKREDFFRELENVVGKIVKDNPDFHNWFDFLGKENIVKVEKAILEHNFHSFDETDENYEKLLCLVSKKADIGRNIALYFLKNTDDNLGFLKFEYLILGTFLKLAPVLDKIYIKWRNYLLNSELGKKVLWLESEKQGKGSAWIQELGLTNKYTVPMKRDDDFIEIPYVLVFSKEFIQIDQELSNLLDKLDNIKNNSKQKVEVLNLIVYLQKLKDAFMCAKVNELDNKWEQVDLAWMSCRGDLQIVHPMETNYGDPARIRVVPELRVSLKDCKYDYINKNCLKTKKSILRDFKQLYYDLPLTEKSLKLMNNVSLGIYMVTVYSGCYLDFKFIGQIVPNNQKVRLNYGCKIFMDYETTVFKWKKMLKSLKKIFDQKEMEKMLEEFSIDERISVIITGHELGHAAFCLAQTEKKIGSGILPLLEEAKATFTELSTLRERVKQGDFDKGILRRVIISEIFADLRILRSRGETVAEPYYYEALYRLNIFLNLQILYQQADKWHIDLNRDKVIQFYKQAEKLYEELAYIYNNFDAKKAKQFIEQHGVETEKILDLYSKVKQT